MSYITKRNGKWQAAYRGPDGRERTKTFTRRVDADRWISTNRADIARGAWVDPAGGRISFTEYAEKWFLTKADVTEQTRLNIRARLDTHAIPYFEKRSMSSVQPSDLRAFVAHLTAAKRAPSTVKSIYLTTSQVFAQAALDGIIAKSPCMGVTLPKDRRREEMHFLSPAQVNELASAITDRFSALIYTAAYAGLRAGELWALRVGALDLLRGSIAVTESAIEVNGSLTFGPTKTGRKRVVPIPRFLAQMLGEHVGFYIGRRPPRGAFVFTATEGGPVRHRNFTRRHFRPAIARAHDKAIKDDRDDEALPLALRFHDLRHTCAAILIADGRHMEEVKDHLGHSSIRVTSDRYGHLFPSARQALAEGLEAVFQRTSAQNPADMSRTSGVFQILPNAHQDAI